MNACSGHEDQPDEGEDQDVACEHVRVETDAQRDQAHELAQDLERDDQHEQALRHVRDPALEVPPRAVVANPLDVREDEGQQGERQRHRQGRRRRVDAPDGDAVPRLAGQRQRDEAEDVDRPDEQQQREDVREPEAHGLGRQALLGDLHLRDVVDPLADGLPLAGLAHQPEAKQEVRQQDRDRRPEEQVRRRPC